VAGSRGEEELVQRLLVEEWRHNRLQYAATTPRQVSSWPKSLTLAHSQDKLVMANSLPPKFRAQADWGHFFGISIAYPLMNGTGDQIFALLAKKGMDVPERSDGARERLNFLRDAACKAHNRISNAFKLTSSSISNLGDLAGRVFFSDHIPANGSCGFECCVQHHSKVYPHSPPRTSTDLRRLVVSQWDREVLSIKVLQLNEHAGRKYEVAKAKERRERTESDR